MKPAKRPKRCGSQEETAPESDPAREAPKWGPYPVTGARGDGEHELRCDCDACLNG